MAFRDLIRDLVSTAFVILDDLPLVVSYKQVAGVSYNPETGAIVENSTTQSGLSAVFARFGLNEKDSEVVVTTDSKVLIPAKDLNVTPGINDQIINGGKTYNVQRILGVPGDSLHILHVREV